MRLALLFCLIPVAAQPVDLTPVDRVMDESLATLGGNANLLLIHDGKVIYRKSFGKYNADTVVPIASASKWISASVVMRLVEKRKL